MSDVIGNISSYFEEMKRRLADFHI
jgi:hypothetical protein